MVYMHYTRLCMYTRLSYASLPYDLVLRVNKACKLDANWDNMAKSTAVAASIAGSMVIKISHRATVWVPYATSIQIKHTTTKY